jgi:F0F1-type ATP synthase membrane subunit c/vacuolar-type H+-ATPase subunit K
MNPSARLLEVVCALAIGLGLAGCSPTSGKSWGAGGGSVSRTENGVTVSYTVQQLTCDGRVYLVLAR